MLNFLHMLFSRSAASW